MKKETGFTLIELLVVLSVLAILAALLFPVFASAREEGRKAQCLSNLHQLGGAIELYTSDYDEHIPYAIDVPEKQGADAFFPADDLSIVQSMPIFMTSIQPYIKSAAVFQCPSEHAFEYQSSGYFNYFQKFGSSYFYAMYPAFLNYSVEDWANPAVQLLIADASPWHGGDDPYSFRAYRINELFADFHVKDVSWTYYLTTAIPWGVPDGG